MFILSLLSIICLFSFTAVKRIIPKPGRFIELSANNKNMLSDYSFNFFLEEDSLVGKFKTYKSPKLPLDGGVIGRFKHSRKGRGTA